MKLTTRSRQATPPPGIRGVARVDRRPRELLTRARAGDVVVTDHLDLDRATAQSLADTGIAALVNGSSMLSGRYPALGPQILTDAGIVVVDGAGGDVLAAVRDGAELRVHEGEVFAGDRLVASGRPVDATVLAGDLEHARTGLVAQLESFTHNSTEFLRREQDLLLHGQGVPTLRTKLDGRPVVVVGDGHDHREQLRRMKRFLAEQDPVLIAVEGGADALRQAGHRPDVVIIDSATRDEALPSLKTLRGARDVVVRLDRGTQQGLERIERLGVRPLQFEAGTTAEDAALVVADAGGASVIVGVGLHATIEDFLDRQRPGLASTYLTRLKVGAKLVDARTLPSLYSGRVRPWHLLLVLLVGVLALLAAIAVTPVGQEWIDQLRPALAGLSDRVSSLSGSLEGLLPQ
ncbi:hypothetical protein K8W59_07970 [Nocardioides rotundus]|uniref:putative cytokinetic ring protein SteA n=1 Tax=Nocardioides rotundus TaxID=1774216 RepID=UPI001CC04F35|nr:putative cytokinetic ring protein SteA [Nocardioides rotundus]UAL31371.1 hypothetical protein K8W59_07970 [Nocardioides rotundus]